MNHLKLSIIAALCVILAFPLSSHAQDEFTKEKTFIEKYIPWLKLPVKKQVEHDPSKTMTAPFSEEVVPKSNSQLDGLYEEAIAKKKLQNTQHLYASHRSHGQMEQWITEAIGASFNFKLSDMNGFKKVISPFYSDNGINDFKILLLKMNAVGIMQSNQKKIAGYITEPPALKKESEEDGIYSWIYDANVIISYLDDSTPPREVEAINRQYRIRLKISRTADTDRHGDGMHIEKMSAKRIKIVEE